MPDELGEVRRALSGMDEKDELGLPTVRVVQCQDIVTPRCQDIGDGFEGRRRASVGDALEGTTVMSIREEFVLKALEPRTNLAAVCREFGVSRKTGYKWLERNKSGGVLALREERNTSHIRLELPRSLSS